MRLGKASAFAVFATAYVAEHESHAPVHGREIARHCGIPAEYLLKILQRLVRSNVLRSERGRNGGFRMRKPAGQTTLLEVVEAIDGPIDGELTAREEINAADASKDIVARLCDDVARHARARLEETTVAHLVSARTAREREAASDAPDEPSPRQDPTRTPARTLASVSPQLAWSAN